MDKICFTINDKKYEAGCELNGSTTLNSFIRNHACLPGTKAMCHEGGCGACIVSVRATNWRGDEEVFSVNSCLVSIFSCDGWKIKTIEGLGSRKTGYHPIQERLAKFNGSQCGYCSCAWIMNFYSLYEQSNKKLTMKQIERSFGSNTCRCTGYRPILDTLKSFAVDRSEQLTNRLRDIEDLSKIRSCAKTGEICTKSCADYDAEHDWCVVNMDKSLELDRSKPIFIDLKEYKYYKVFSIGDIYNVWDKEGTDSYILIAGNTGKGVLRSYESPRVWIDINGVNELKKYAIDVNLVVGGATTLTKLMEIFRKTAETEEYFWYLPTLADHIDLVAHVPVRNLGTIAGNLMLKHRDRSFQSDIFVLLETVGATLTILSNRIKKNEVSPAEFLKTDMAGKIIYSIELPPLLTSYQLRTFKIMPRAQNSHALVNAGFLFQFNNSKTEVKFASIVYGSISGSFHHATKTERYIKGKDIFNNKQLQDTLKVLRNEIRPEDAAPDPSPEFRRILAVNLFYKAIIDMCPTSRINKRYRSGGTMFDRPLSKGSQQFQTDNSLFPLTKAMPKMESAIQCSGEAIYSNDLPPMCNEVYAAFVLSTIHSGEIRSIDASEALKIDGVLKLVVAKDIPGKNTFIRSDLQLMVADEEIISSGKILYYGQAVAIIVAKTEFLAKRAANLVKVEYKNVSENLPVLTIPEAKKDKARIAVYDSLKPTDRGNNVEKIIKGTYYTKGQFHYPMETQTCVVVPIDNVFDVYSSTQWMDANQIAVADMLNIPESRVNVITRRVGGAFGGKLSRSAQVATACALVAHLLDVPCRFVAPLETVMALHGKRAPCYSEYEIGVDKKGKIQYLINNYYEDDGCSRNENITAYTLDSLKNCYDFSTWSLQANTVLTDIASTTTFRAPGGCEGIATIEHIMERIAFETREDPVAVRIANMRKTDNPLPQLIEEFEKDVKFDSRAVEVAAFNRENRWKKRAIKLTTMSFPIIFYGNYSALLSVFHSDGSVVVSIGGIEMGQGVNTKVAQVVAFKFGVPFETVTVTPHYTYTSPNNVFSGSSITSECSCYSAAKACDTILQRLQPVRAGMTNPTWKELIAKAHKEEIDLQASYMMSPKEKDLAGYSAFGLALLELELDLLTGNFQLIRVDILEDTGQSMNPDLDVGQVEGAFVQGLGMWTMEDLKYDKKTGKILTDRSWNYKVPGALDIPADFRVKLRYNSRNPAGVLGSKAAGEPPLCMAQVVTHALRDAVVKSRAESGHSLKEWVDIELPCTNENIVMAADYEMEEFLLQ